MENPFDPAAAELSINKTASASTSVTESIKLKAASPESFDNEFASDEVIDDMNLDPVPIPLPVTSKKPENVQTTTTSETCDLDSEFASSEVIPPELLDEEPTTSRQKMPILKTTIARKVSTSSSPTPQRDASEDGQQQREQSHDSQQPREQSIDKSSSEATRSEDRETSQMNTIRMINTRTKPFVLRRVVPLRPSRHPKRISVTTEPTAQTDLTMIPSSSNAPLPQLSNFAANSRQHEGMTAPISSSVHPDVFKMYHAVEQDKNLSKNIFNQLPPVAQKPPPRTPVPVAKRIVDIAAMSIYPIINDKPPLIGGPSVPFSNQRVPTLGPPWNQPYLPQTLATNPLVHQYGSSIPSSSGVPPTSSTAPQSFNMNMEDSSATPQSSSTRHSEAPTDGERIETKTHPDPITEPKRYARQKDAIEYLDEIKQRFSSEIYHNFLDVMKFFKLQNIDTINVIRQVCYLFSADMNLVLGFNNFLPQNFNINHAGGSIVTIRNPNGFCYTVDVRRPPDSQAIITFDPSKSSFLSAESDGISSKEVPLGGMLQAAFPGDYQLPSSSTTLAPKENKSVYASEPMEVDQQPVKQKSSTTNFHGKSINSALTFLKVLKTRLSPLQLEDFNAAIEKYDKTVMTPKLAKEMHDELSKIFNYETDLLTGFTCFKPELRPWCKSGTLEREEHKIIPSRLAQEGLINVSQAASSMSTDFVEPRLTETCNEEPVERLRPVNALMQHIPHADIDEFVFFTKVREAINDDHVFENFSNILRIYNQNLLSKGQMLSMINGFFTGFPLLLREFKRIMNLDVDAVIEKPYVPPPDDDDPTRDLSKTLRADMCMKEAQKPPDYQMIKNSGRSYRVLPSKYRKQTCSGRTPEMDAVLNDNWIIIPSWQSEETNRASFKKSSLEEFLHRVEDERFEIGILRQVNGTAMAALERIQIYVNENPNYKVDDRFECDSKVLMLRAMRRAYGENAGRVMEGLKANPGIIAPTVLNRLRLKEREWQNLNSAFELMWSDQAKKYWAKTHEAKVQKMKLMENRELRGTGILMILERMFARRINGGASKKLDMSKGPYYMPITPRSTSYKYNAPQNKEAIAAYKLRKQRRWYPELDTEDVIDFSDDVPMGHVRGSCAATAVTLDFNVRWNRIYDLNQLLLRCLSRFPKTTHEEKHLVKLSEHFIKEIMPAVFDIQPVEDDQPYPKRNTANKAIGGPSFQPRLFFADEICLHVMTMYHCCAIRLHRLAERAKVMSREERFESDLIQQRIQAWRDAGEAPPLWSDGDWARPNGWGIMLPKRARVFDRYAMYLSDLAAVIDGKMTVKSFEDHTRNMYQGETFPIVGLEKYIITIVKQILQIVETPSMKAIIDKFWQNSIQTTPQKYDEYIARNMTAMSDLFPNSNHYLIEVFDARNTFVAFRMIKYVVPIESRKERFNAAHWKSWKNFLNKDSSKSKASVVIDVHPLFLMKSLRNGWINSGRFPVNADYEESTPISSDEDETNQTTLVDNDATYASMDDFDEGEVGEVKENFDDVEIEDSPDFVEDGQHSDDSASLENDQRQDDEVMSCDEVDADDTVKINEEKIEDTKIKKALNYAMLNDYYDLISDEEESAFSDEEYKGRYDNYDSDEDSNFEEPTDSSQKSSDEVLYFSDESIEYKKKLTKRLAEGYEDDTSEYSSSNFSTDSNESESESLAQLRNNEERELMEEMEEDVLSTVDVDEDIDDDDSTDYEGDGLERYAAFSDSDSENLDKNFDEVEIAKSLIRIATRVLDCTHAKEVIVPSSASSTKDSSDESTFSTIYDNKHPLIDKTEPEKPPKETMKQKQRYQPLPPPAAPTQLPVPPTLVNLAPSSAVQVTKPRLETSPKPTMKTQRKTSRGSKVQDIVKPSRKSVSKTSPQQKSSLVNTRDDAKKEAVPKIKSSTLTPAPVATSTIALKKTPKPIVTTKKSVRITTPPSVIAPAPITICRESSRKSTSRQPIAVPMEPLKLSSPPTFTRKRRVSPEAKKVSPVKIKSPTPVKAKSPVPVKTPPKPKPLKSPPKAVETPKPKRRKPSVIYRRLSTSTDSEDSNSGETRIIALEDLPANHELLKDILPEAEIQRRMNKFNLGLTYKTMKKQIRTLSLIDVVSDTDHDYEDEKIVKHAEKHMKLTRSDCYWWSKTLKLKSDKLLQLQKRQQMQQNSDDEANSDEGSDASSEYGVLKRRSSTSGKSRRGGRKSGTGKGGRPRKNVNFDPNMPGPSNQSEGYEHTGVLDEEPLTPPPEEKEISPCSSICSVKSTDLVPFVVPPMPPVVAEEESSSMSTSSSSSLSSSTESSEEEVEEEGEEEEKETTATARRSETIASSRTSSNSPIPAPSVSVSTALADLMVEARPSRSETTESEPREIRLPGAPRMYDDDDDLHEEARGGAHDTRFSSPDLDLENLYLISDNDEDGIEIARGDRSERSRSRSRSPIETPANIEDDFDHSRQDRSPPRRIITRSRSRSLQPPSVPLETSNILPYEPMDTLSETDDNVNNPENREMSPLALLSDNENEGIDENAGVSTAPVAMDDVFETEAEAMLADDDGGGDENVPETAMDASPKIDNVEMQVDDVEPEPIDADPSVNDDGTEEPMESKPETEVDDEIDDDYVSIARPQKCYIWMTEQQAEMSEAHGCDNMTVFLNKTAPNIMYRFGAHRMTHRRDHSRSIKSERFEQWLDQHRSGTRTRQNRQSAAFEYPQDSRVFQTLHVPSIAKTEADVILMDKELKSVINRRNKAIAKVEKNLRKDVENAAKIMAIHRNRQKMAEKLRRAAQTEPSPTPASRMVRKQKSYMIKRCNPDEYERLWLYPP